MAGSWRIQGAASEKVSTMPDRRQAATLSPGEIQLLETLVCDVKRDFFSRQIAWVFLVLTSLRFRYGDMYNILSMQEENELIEVTPSRTKTSHRDKSRLKLTMLSPLKLFTGLPWHDVHVRERESRVCQLHRGSFHQLTTADHTSTGRARVLIITRQSKGYAGS